jgi:hypothetical protein
LCKEYRSLSSSICNLLSYTDYETHLIESFPDLLFFNISWNKISISSRILFIFMLIFLIFLPVLSSYGILLWDGLFWGKKWLRLIRPKQMFLLFVVNFNDYIHTVLIVSTDVYPVRNYYKRSFLWSIIRALFEYIQ